MEIIINLITLLILPFIAAGVIKKTKAFFSGKKGINLFQPFFDFIKLMKKEAVYSNTTSFIFKMAPVVNLACVIFASLFVPLVFGYAFINVQVGFVIFSYILAFGKFFSLIAALDTGSSFEGMGASREACFSTMVEPAFFVGMGSIAALTKFSSFESFKLILENSGVYGILIIALMVGTLFIMLLIEGCRVPVDDPETHLELTMIHEVMVLDNSGVDLGFITLASYIKMFLFESLIAALLIPYGINPLIGAGLFLLIILFLSFIVGVVESITARFRMSHVFEFVFVMSIASLLILTLTTYKIYGN